MKTLRTVLTGSIVLLSFHALAAGGTLEPTTDQFIQAAGLAAVARAATSP